MSADALPDPSIRPTTVPPVLCGERVQVLVMGPRGTHLADAWITAIHHHGDGWEVTAKCSDARASFHLISTDAESATLHHPRVRFGADHTRP